VEGHGGSFGPPESYTVYLLMEVYHMPTGIYKPITDEGIYAELMRFHHETEVDMDDLDWKEGWNLEEELSLRRFVG
jgi:hypothetical protein